MVGSARPKFTRDQVSNRTSLLRLKTQNSKLIGTFSIKKNLGFKPDRPVAFVTLVDGVGAVEKEARPRKNLEMKF